MLIKLSEQKSVSLSTLINCSHCVLISGIMKKANVCLTLLLSLSTVCSAYAADSITFYEDEYYSGRSFRLEGSGQISNLRDKDLGSTDNFNDEISSILISGNFKLTLYENKDFGGQSVEINLSRPYLDVLSNDDWNDRISSIKWEPLTPASEAPKVVFYDQANFRGNSFVINGDGSISRLIDKRRGRLNWNDQIRSVKVFGKNPLVILYRDARYKGGSTSIISSTANLGRFNAVASSLKVYD